jgi:TPR repeat protein
MHAEEVIPDMTMACNLGIPDACIALKKMRNRQEFRQFMLR